MIASYTHTRNTKITTPRRARYNSTASPQREYRPKHARSPTPQCGVHGVAGGSRGQGGGGQGGGSQGGGSCSTYSDHGGVSQGQGGRPEGSGQGSGWPPCPVAGLEYTGSLGEYRVQRSSVQVHNASFFLSLVCPQLTKQRAGCCCCRRAQAAVIIYVPG